MWRQELTNILISELDIIQTKNPRFSLRAYSKKIGIGFGSLSDIINDKRSISPRLAKKIITKIGLDSIVQKRLISLIDME